jgi:membrane peptidoglycan carboxypeptidase
VADGVNRVLSAVMEPGGTGGHLNFGKWDLAGKTGTIQENRAVWFAGYAPNLAGAAVVADATLPYTNLMYGHTLDGVDISDPTGSGTAGPLWKTAMQNALNGMPLRRFTAPSDRLVNGTAAQKKAQAELDKKYEAEKKKKEEKNKPKPPKPPTKPPVTPTKPPTKPPVTPTKPPTKPPVMPPPPAKPGVQR